MNTSPEVDQIAPALVAALNAMDPVDKDGTGNWGSYASIKSVIATIKPVLAEHDLGAQQTVGHDDGRMIVRTRVWHISGQWVEDDGLEMVAPPDPQKLLAALTYGRRGEEMAFFNLAPGGDATDDDGQTAAAAVHEMSEVAAEVGASIKALDSNAREELAGWVREQGKRWPIMPRDLHGNPGWAQQVADHLGVSS